ncbi:adenylate cyclase-like protein [Flagelloscypha sp. PMI_526]|nr:adenylate cyclase-like protein [Flagelloscypha sp. PMI_526]
MSPDSWAIEIEEEHTEENEAVFRNEGDGAAGQGGSGNARECWPRRRTLMFGDELGLPSCRSPGIPVPPNDIRSRKRRRKQAVTSADNAGLAMTSSASPSGFRDSSRGSFVPNVAEPGGRLSGGASRLAGNSEEHRLYLQERGKERILASTDKPAGIVKRRMEQAGYDLADGLDLLAGSGLNFMLRFVWKPQLLGGADEERDINLDSFEFIDLAARDLRSLTIQNNRIQTLPRHLSRLRVLSTLNISNNKFKEMPPVITQLEALRDLDISFNMISELPEDLDHLRSLGTIVRFPDCASNLLNLKDLDCRRNLIGDLSLVSMLPKLEKLSAEYNNVASLDMPIGPKLAKLNASHNDLTKLILTPGPTQSLTPYALTLLDISHAKLASLDDIALASLSGLECPALMVVNLAYNKLRKWLDPPLAAAASTEASVVAPPSASASSLSLTHSSSTTTLPPLAYSLERLYLGENNLTEDGLLTLTLTRELRVLNLSFNALQELPTGLFRHLTNLEELYLSGNKLTNLQPANDLPKMHRLSTLFLNGNRLQNLPQELGQVPNLMVLDVGSNMLKHSSNTEWDWNWNSNKNLKYLNISGKCLMDVITAAGGLNRGVDIPEETDERRVRKSMSVINGMYYGIADTLGKNQQLNMLDLVYEYRDRPGQAVFAMFGRALPPKHVPPGASTNKLAKFLHDNFIDTFNGQLDAVRHNPGISTANQTPDALRRTFLKLNQDLHGDLYHSRRTGSSDNTAAPVDPTVARSGASGVVLYFMGAQLWVANAGNALAVISRDVNGFELLRDGSRLQDSSTMSSIFRRSFGYYHLFPIVNARPDIRMRDLTHEDEFIIVANRGLWDYVSYQTAVDIARRELESASRGRKVKKPRINRELDRLHPEVDPPTGHVTLAFTDIRNSTRLWESNPGMPAAVKIHNTMLRRYLRICAGYEVKTEGDAFMCAFQNTLSALWWCLICQLKLLEEPWPLEILECDDGKDVFDVKGQLIARGLSVRMGIHCGEPICEREPHTKRMDYFGPMVNCAARIQANARGGQIACSTDIVREIMAKIHETGPLTPYSEFQSEQAIEKIKALGAEVIEVGEVKLKGLAATELLSIVYPTSLNGRHYLEEETSDGICPRFVSHPVQHPSDKGHWYALSPSREPRSRPDLPRSK